ncbi:MAG: DegT/DnrJ/EryC1/StrS aminotransferase family protein [Proteobacteria bacterium]|nr:DegT/DnrJ/EryC1/StrS aminotransferase family protein [Pseudomonadota bacterium]
MSKPTVSYTRPSITELEVAFVTDAARNGWGSKCYEYIDRFERDFCLYTGARFAIATSSCTGALHMGLAALGVGAGHEVIIADTNWIASVAPIVHLGATPRFVDVDPDSWCLDAQAVERAITPRTRAIVAVHLYGNLCPMDELLEVADRHGLPLVEDAAEALGSAYQGKHAGTMGAFGAFSFHGTKAITTGEGGAFITNDEKLYERVLTLSNHGRAKGQTKQFWPDAVGFKYKMSNLQAALGCAQIERVDDLVARKRAVFAYYADSLLGLNGIKMNPEAPGNTNSYWMPTVVFDSALGVTRDQILEAFAEENIDARVFFWPLSGLDMFEDVPENRNAWDIANRAINLPSYFDMTNTDQDRVIAVVHSLVQGEST